MSLKKIYIYLYFLPSHLCITLPSCCRNVIYDKVTGEGNSAWKAAALTESKTETKKNKTLDSKCVSWEGTGIRGWTIKDQNNYMVKLEYLGQKFQAFTICFYTFNDEKSLYPKYTSNIKI